MRQQVTGTILGVQGESYEVVAEYDDFSGNKDENPSHLYIMQGDRVITSDWYNTKRQTTIVPPTADPFILAAYEILSRNELGTCVQYADFRTPMPGDDFQVIDTNDIF